MLTETNYESQKVSLNRLSSLMAFILVNVGDGADRGEIFSRYYGLERRYCGWNVDACLRGKELREYQKLYCEKQPVFTKALKRLEERGFIKLLKHGHCVKGMVLTPEGILLAAELAKTRIEKFKRKEV